MATGSGTEAQGQGMILVQPSFLPIPSLEYTGNIFLQAFPTMLLRMFYRRNTIYHLKKQWIIKLEQTGEDANEILIHYQCKNCELRFCDLNKARYNSETNDMDPIWYVGSNATYSGRSTTLARLKRHERRGCTDIFHRHRRRCIREPPSNVAQQLLDETTTGTDNLDGRPVTCTVTNPLTGENTGGVSPDIVSIMEELFQQPTRADMEPEEDWESNLLHALDHGVGTV